MKRLQNAFENPAFIAYIVGGDPDQETSLEIARTAIKAGADILEIGMPFSDPIADGPVIQEANIRALSGGTTIATVLAMVKKIREESEIPIVLMGYINPILSYGIEAFCNDASAAGVDGILIVDLPPEEADPVIKAAKKDGPELIRLVAPTTSDKRLKMILSGAEGYIYIVALAGVTGVRRDGLTPETAAMINKVRSGTSLPVAVGFGISRPEHVSQVVAAGADGVIVGSAIVSLIGKHQGDQEAMLASVGAYISKMAAATGNENQSGGRQVLCQN